MSLMAYGSFFPYGDGSVAAVVRMRQFLGSTALFWPNFGSIIPQMIPGHSGSGGTTSNGESSVIIYEPSESLAFYSLIKLG